MNRLCENCLTAIIILTAIGVVQLHFIVRNGRLIKDPCTRSIGVHWVRDPKSCSEYYICVTGLPVKMPPCPKKYVWSVAGRNCVPEVSHWNDCPMDLLNQHLEQQEQHRANDGAVAFHNPSNNSFSATSDRMDALMNQADPNEVRINKIKSKCSYLNLSKFLLILTLTDQSFKEQCKGDNVITFSNSTLETKGSRCLL